MSARKVVGIILNVSFELLLVAIIIAVVYSGGTRAYHFGFSIFTESAVDNSPGTDIEITVASGDSDYEIGQMLEKAGLIRDDKLFYVQAKILAFSGKIKAGTYTLNTSMTAEEMIEVMSGETLDDTEDDSDETTSDTNTES